MATTTFPLSVEIGATISSSVGSALRSTESQLARLGAVMGRLEHASLGASRLEELRRQAAEAGRAWRASQAEIERLQAAKASGAWQTKGQASARARVAGLEARMADPGLSEARRAKLAAALAKARERLAGADAKAEERYGRQLARLIEQAARAKDAFERIRAAAAAEQSALERAGIATRQLAGEKAKLGQALEQLKARHEALAKAQAAQQANLDARAAYRAQIGDAIALGGALYGLTQPAIAFEEAMIGLRRVASFSEAEYRRLGEAILDLSTRLPLTSEQLAQIAAQGARVGYAGAELDRFVAAAGRIAVAWGMTGEEAGKELSALRDTYRLAQDEAEATMDAINHLSNQMRAEGGDLLRILAKAGPSARAFGLSAQQMAALGAAFLHMKAEPKAAATAIDSLLKKLATADRQGADFQDALYRIGISAEVFAEMMRRDPQQALVAFLDLVKSRPEGLPLLADLFGQGQADDIARLIDGLDHYKRALAEVADSGKVAGSLEDEYATIAKSTANALQLLKNRTTRLMTELGSALLPGLNALVSAISVPLETLGDLARRFPLLTQVVVGATAGLIGLKLASLGVGYAWTFLKGGALTVWAGIMRVRAALALLRVQALLANPALTGLAGGFQRAVPAIGALNAALLANPMTWVVAGIAAAVAGLALMIRKYWQPLSAWIGGFWDGIKAGVSPAITAIGQALAPLAPIGDVVAAVFERVGGAFAAAFGWVARLFEPVALTQEEFSALAESGRSVGAVIGQGLIAVMQAVTLPLQAVAGLVALLGQGLAKLGEAAEWVSGKVSTVADVGARLMSSFGFGAESKAVPAASTTAGPAYMPSAQPVNRSMSVATSVSAPITIHAPAGADAREIARLVDERLRRMMAEQARNPRALYD